VSKCEECGGILLFGRGKICCVDCGVERLPTFDQKVEMKCRVDHTTLKAAYYMVRDQFVGSMPDGFYMDDLQCPECELKIR